MRGCSGFGAVLALWVAGCGDESGTIRVGDPSDGVLDPTELPGDTDAPSDSDPFDTTPADPCGPDGGITGALESTGSLRHTRTEGQTTFGSCALSWVQYAPPTRSSTLVVLAPDAGRGPEHVRDWAEHLATWGFEVLTPAPCGDDPAADGAAMAAAAEAFAPGRPVIYAGHGTGGLAALLAAAADADAVGVLGLDPTDVDGLGKPAAASLDLPVRGLVGDPHSCNGQGNARQVFRAAADGAYLVVRDADHCAFESPTDAGCTDTCGEPQGLGDLDDETQRRGIRALLVAYALWASGDDLDGRGWWTRGCPGLESLQHPEEGPIR